MGIARFHEQRVELVVVVQNKHAVRIPVLRRARFGHLGGKHHGRIVSVPRTRAASEQDPRRAADHEQQRSSDRTVAHKDAPCPQRFRGRRFSFDFHEQFLSGMKPFVVTPILLFKHPGIPLSTGRAAYRVHGKDGI